jgi:hypothetical protein
MMEDSGQSKLLSSISANQNDELPIFNVHSEPVMIEAINEKGEDLSEIVKKNFDFRPTAIIEKLGLRNPIFRQTATYGHFGKVDLPWEKIDPVRGREGSQRPSASNGIEKMVQ